MKDKYEFGLALVQEAGELALGYFNARDQLTVKNKGPQDLASEADLNTELLIRDRLAKAFPQIDVRERLSVSTGYGVAELLVHSDADVVGKTLGDSGLRDRDITVLTLHRGTTVIPNPFPHHVLQPDDRLLCFGKLEEMRSMIPSRRKRIRKVKRLPKDPIHEG